MKLSACFAPVFLALLTSASPLGHPSLFARHKHTRFAPRDIRRFILRSDLNIPSSCSSNLPPTGASSVANTTIPDLTGLNSTLPNSDDDTTVDSTGDTSADNSAAADNSTAAKRHFSGSSHLVGDFSSSSIVSESSTVSEFSEISFSEYETLCEISGGSLAGFENDFSGEVFGYGFGGCINWAGIDGVSALFAEADVCEQQHNADFMISWAKLYGGKHVHDYIEQAIAYRKYPRRVVEVLGYYPATPYCHEIPVNTELYGVWNEQFEGVNYGLYGGPSYPLISFGSDGTCPWGMESVVDSCSCIPSMVSGNATITADSDSGDLMPDATSTVADITPTTDSTAADSDSGATDTSSVAAQTASAADAESTDDASASDDSSDTNTDSTDGVDGGASATDSSAAAGNTLTPDTSDPNGRRK